MFASEHNMIVTVRFVSEHRMIFTARFVSEHRIITAQVNLTNLQHSIVNIYTVLNTEHILTAELSINILFSFS